MPRKSAAALSVVPLAGEQRPEPPAELTKEQAAEWRAVVGRLPPDWFPRETHALLVAYCQHIVRGRIVAKLLDACRPEETSQELRRFDKLAMMADREGRAISSLATRMRLSPDHSWRLSAGRVRGRLGHGSGWRLRRDRSGW
jgi:hypothetical protein